MSLLLKRKSIRKFNNQEVEPEKITNILKAAFQAPSAKNQQPWEFYVVRNQEILKKLSTISPGAKPLEGAPVAIIPVFKQTLKSPHFIIEDMAAATENILLEVVNQGLGGVWIGVYPLDDRTSQANSILNLPESLNAYSIIALGYYDESYDIKLRYDESKVHYIE